ncbi:MAG TPA: ASPIC/UnbV domain-containing protein [Gemmataceae bacterium]|nr:ASPIC/UnbV domain-containing protein [Gemmataceae bacterium]
MSQPYDRSARVGQPGKLDESLGEWWVENPWDISSKGKNLSAYERKRCFLNVRGPDQQRAFLDISYLTGADNDGDGRSVVAGDFRNNGRQDLVVRMVGGGAVKIYENHFPQQHYLEISLRGTKSNRQGIGARLVARVKGRQLVRELFPHNSYRSQAPSIVHFGLAKDDQIDELEIRWPSGDVQKLTGLKAVRHVVIAEGRSGASAVEEVVPGRTIRP